MHAATANTPNSPSPTPLHSCNTTLSTRHRSSSPGIAAPCPRPAIDCPICTAMPNAIAAISAQITGINTLSAIRAHHLYRLVSSSMRATTAPRRIGDIGQVAGISVHAAASARETIIAYCRRFRLVLETTHVFWHPSHVNR
jgi:hypothetical protein